MSFFKGLARGLKDSEEKKEREAAVEERKRLEEKADTRWQQEFDYRVDQDKKAEEVRLSSLDREKQAQMAELGFILDDDGNYVHVSTLKGSDAADASRSKMTGKQTEAAARHAVNLEEEIKRVYMPIGEQGPSIPGGEQSMTETEMNWFDTLKSEPQALLTVMDFYENNKDEYGLTLDQLPTLYTLNVNSKAGQAHLTSIAGDDKNAFALALHASQQAAGPSVVAQMNTGMLPLSQDQENDQYVKFFEVALPPQLAKEKSRLLAEQARARAAQDENRYDELTKEIGDITGLEKDLKDAKSRGNAITKIMSSYGADFLTRLEDSGSPHWRKITANSLITAYVPTATPVEREDPFDSNGNLKPKFAEKWGVELPKTRTAGGADLAAAAAAAPAATPVTAGGKPITPYTSMEQLKGEYYAMTDTGRKNQQEDPNSKHYDPNNPNTGYEVPAGTPVGTEIESPSNGVTYVVIDENGTLKDKREIEYERIVEGASDAVTSDTTMSIGGKDVTVRTTDTGEWDGKTDDLNNGDLIYDTKRDEVYVMEDGIVQLADDDVAALVRAARTTTTSDLEATQPQAAGYTPSPEPIGSSRGLDLKRGAGRDLDSDMSIGFDANRTPTVSMAIAEDVRKAIESEDVAAVEKLLETHGPDAIEAAIDEVEASGYIPSPEPLVQKAPIKFVDVVAKYREEGVVFKSEEEATKWITKNFKGAALTGDDKAELAKVIYNHSKGQ